MVYVQFQNGQPATPTEHYGKIRRLLNEGKAKVVRKSPFTIRLLYETTEFTPEYTLGVDTGSGTLAAAVSDEKGNIVYMSEVALRNDIHPKMKRRARYRRDRRNRKTRYRACRPNNRKASRRKDRFSPTMMSKHHSHEKEIAFVKQLLPISHLVLETGTFDTHLMQDPSLANENKRHWGYQKGPNYGYANTHARVLARDGYTCQCCKGKRKDSHLEVHHILPRSQGGSDDAENLVTLCHTCHTKLHAGKIHPKLGKGKPVGNLRYATQMNSIRKQLLRRHPEATETFGYVTKSNRMSLGIPKEHYCDACVIATDGKPFVVKTLLYKKRCVPEGDFQQTKGIRSQQPLNTGKVEGFRKFDKVLYLGKEYFIKGKDSNGYAVLMDIDKNKIDFSYMPRGMKTPKFSLMQRIEARTSWITTTMDVTRNIA